MMTPQKQGTGKSKKEQFTGKKESRLPFIAGGLILIGVAVLLIFIFRGGDEEESAVTYFGDPVAAERSYVGRVASMTEVEALVEGDWITLPLETVEQADIVYFEVENNEGFSVPLMAYITPSGRLFAGSSMCEPCRGRYFSLAGETLVCDTCRTTYTIEEHRFITGSPACGSYPPVYMSPEVDGDKVKIALAQVLQWRIRAY
jgi:hypothetical protein